MRFHELSATVRNAVCGAIVVLMLATSSATARELGHTYQLLVDGLACPFCAYGIEKQISKIEGVETISIDINTGTITVSMAVGAELDEPAAREAVEAAAFTLRGYKKVPTTDSPER